MIDEHKLPVIQVWVDDPVCAFIVYELDYAKQPVNTRNLEKRIALYKVPKQTFYRRLKRLEKEGWVERRGEHKGRSPGVFVSLTSKALRRLSKLRDDEIETAIDQFNEFFKVAPIDDSKKMEWIRRLLETFSNHMKKVSPVILLECIKEPNREDMQSSFVRLWGGQTLIRVHKVLQLLYENKELIIRESAVLDRN